MREHKQLSESQKPQSSPLWAGSSRTNSAASPRGRETVKVAVSSHRENTLYLSLGSKNSTHRISEENSLSSLVSGKRQNISLLDISTISRLTLTWDHMVFTLAWNWLEFSLRAMLNCTVYSYSRRELLFSTFMPDFVGFSQIFMSSQFNYSCYDKPNVCCEKVLLM